MRKVKKEMTAVTFRLSKELLEGFDQVCEEKYRSKTSVLVELIISCIKKHVEEKRGNQ